MKQKIAALLNYLYHRPEIVFVVIASVFGLFSVVFVPQMSVTDENAHFLRAYQVARGEFVCEKVSTYPKDVTDKSISGSNGSRAYTMDFTDKIDESVQKRHTCSSAAGYSPVGYAPQALGVVASELIHPTAATMVLLARTVNLLVYVGAGYLIIRKVRVAKYVFFVILLIPQMIHLAASLSADMMNNILTLAVFALILNLFVQSAKISNKQIMVLVALIVLGALLKPSLILILIPLLFLPAKLFTKNKLSGIPFNIKKWVLGVSALALAAAAYLLWSYVSHGATTPMSGGLPNPIEDHPNLFINLLFNTYFSDYGDLVLRGVFGEFSSFLYHFPTILVTTQIIVLLMVLLYPSGIGDAVDKLRKSRAFIISSASAFIVSILAITYGLYTAWGLKRGITLYADGVQGRYFTALLALLIPLFVWLSSRISISVKSDKLFFNLIVVTQVVILSFYVLYTVKTITNM